MRRLVRRFPDYWYGQAQLGILLLDVGRENEAAEAYRRTLNLQPMVPNFWLRYAGALHHAGREQEADLAFDEALESGTGLAKYVEIVRSDTAKAEGQNLAAMSSFLLLFGAVDLALDALEASYLGGVIDGRRLPPPAATDRRSTAVLWGSTILKHRDNPRYVNLLDRIGLEDYWRKSGTQPDYRKFVASG